MLAFGYKSFESVSADIEMTNENFVRLQGLVFNELVENQDQSARNQDKDLLKVCKKRIKSMYKLFFNNAAFEKFAVQDLLQRGTQTIEIIRRDDAKIDLEGVTVSDLIKKNHDISDPVALSFLAEQLIKMGKLSVKTEG